MQVTLMHNPSAGRRKYSKKKLMTALAKAGHKSVYQSTKKKGYKKALKKPGDLVLVAGGDGAVGKIASKLIDSGIPLSVLPLGTANNLARALGFDSEPEKIIDGLEAGENRPVDVGLANGPCGDRHFFEGAGGGLLADYIRAAEAEDKKEKKSKTNSSEQEMQRHVALLRRLLGDYAAVHWEIRVDGEDVSDHYLLWEAMNINSVGPALYLAPRATTKDGQFDFVCVRKEDRALLMTHLEARLAGKKSRYSLPTRRFQKLEIKWNGSTLHFDDELWPREKETVKSQDIELVVKSSALLVRRPRTAKAKRIKRAKYLGKA
jgi:diacylglycerol kinase family enzyme